MRRTALCFVLLIAGSSVHAKNSEPYQAGQLLQMNSVPCKAGQLNKTASICQEYTLQSENVVYHIRPRHHRHRIDLSLDQRANFRLQGNSILLRPEPTGSKEQRFTIISVSPVTDANTADSHPIRLNHLQ